MKKNATAGKKAKTKTRTSGGAAPAKRKLAARSALAVQRPAATPARTARPTGKQPAAAKTGAAPRGAARADATRKRTAGGTPVGKKQADSGAVGEGASASRLIDARIRELVDWRGAALAHVRALISQALPAVVEEWKWRGVPVWSSDGIICTGETYRSVVKMTFAKGAALADPTRLFNASLEGGTRRAIDLREGETLDAQAFQALVLAAAALNRAKAC
jgi:hypothetical protein